MDPRPIKRGSDAVVTPYGYTYCEASTYATSFKRQRQTGSETLNSSFTFNSNYSRSITDFPSIDDRFDLQPSLEASLVCGRSEEINENFDTPLHSGIGFSNSVIFPTTCDDATYDPLDMLVGELHYGVSTSGNEPGLTGRQPQVEDNLNPCYENIGSLDSAESLLPLLSPDFTAMISSATDQAFWSRISESGEMFGAQLGNHPPQFPPTALFQNEPVVGEGLVSEAPLYRIGPDQLAVQLLDPNPMNPLNSLANSGMSLPFRPTAGSVPEGLLADQPIASSPPTIQRSLLADNWINTNLDSDVFKGVDGVNLADGPRVFKKLGRRGGLDPQQAREAREVRLAKACYRCKFMKNKCSAELGSPCKRCEAYFSPSLAKVICKRQRLEEFVDVLFPLGSEYGDTALQKVHQEHISVLCNNEIEIGISHGPTYPLMTFHVGQFQPPNYKILAQAHIAGGVGSGHKPGFGVSYATPFALTSSAQQALRNKCVENMEATMEGPRNRGEIYYKETSIVPWEVFLAVDKYWRSTQDPVVARALKLHAMQYYMVQDIRLCEKSARKAKQSLVGPTSVEYTFSLPSKVIIVQVKHMMSILLREMAADVLHAIAGIKERRSNWAPTFCAILMLCKCVEMVQVDLDLPIVHEMEKGARKTRDATLDYIRELDYTIDLCIETFHKGFKSHRKGGSNPIRDGLKASEDAATVQLVATICGIIKEHEDEMEERVKKHSFDFQSGDMVDLLANHLLFRDRNPGRLVSKMLRSFSKWKMG